MDQNLQSLSTRAGAGAVGCADVVGAGYNGVEGSHKDGVDEQEEVDLVEVGGERNVVVGACGDGYSDVDAAGRDGRVALALFEGRGKGNPCKEESSGELQDGLHLADCCGSDVGCLIKGVWLKIYVYEGIRLKETSQDKHKGEQVHRLGRESNAFYIEPWLARPIISRVPRFWKYQGMDIILAIMKIDAYAYQDVSFSCNLTFRSIEVRGEGSITRCSFRAEEINLKLFPLVRMSYQYCVAHNFFFSSGILGLLALQG
jgi:hypothetical protein